MSVATDYLAGGLTADKATLAYRRFVALYGAVLATIGAGEQTTWLADINAKFGPQVETVTGFRKLPESMQEHVVSYGRARLLELRYIDNVGALPAYGSATRFLPFYITQQGQNWYAMPKKVRDVARFAAELLDIESRGALLSDFVTDMNGLSLPASADAMYDRYDANLCEAMIAIARSFGSPWASLGINNELDIGNSAISTRLRDDDIRANLEIRSWFAEDLFWGTGNMGAALDLIYQDDFGTTVTPQTGAAVRDLFQLTRDGMHEARRLATLAEIIAHGYAPAVVIRKLAPYERDLPKYFPDVAPFTERLLLPSVASQQPNVNATPVGVAFYLRVPAGVLVDHIVFALESSELDGIGAPLADPYIDAQNPNPVDADTFTLVSSLVSGKRRWLVTIDKAAKWDGGVAGAEFNLGSIDAFIPATAKPSPNPIDITPNNSLFVVTNGGAPVTGFVQTGLRAGTGITGDASEEYRFPPETPIFPVPPL